MNSTTFSSLGNVSPSSSFLFGETVRKESKTEGKVVFAGMQQLKKLKKNDYLSYENSVWTCIRKTKKIEKIESEKKPEKRLSITPEKSESLKKKSQQKNAFKNLLKEFEVFVNLSPLESLEFFHIFMASQWGSKQIAKKKKRQLAIETLYKKHIEKIRVSLNEVYNERFTKLTHEEITNYHKYYRKKSYSLFLPNFYAFTQLDHKITRTFKEQIFSSDDNNIRKATVKSIIEVAFECWNSQNFASTQTLFQVLNAPSTQPLKSQVLLAESEMNEKWIALQSFFSSSSSFDSVKEKSSQQEKSYNPLHSTTYSLDSFTSFFKNLSLVKLAQAELIYLIQSELPYTIEEIKATLIFFQQINKELRQIQAIEEEISLLQKTSKDIDTTKKIEALEKLKESIERKNISDDNHFEKSDLDSKKQIRFDYFQESQKNSLKIQDIEEQISFLKKMSKVVDKPKEIEALERKKEMIILSCNLARINYLSSIQEQSKLFIEEVKKELNEKIKSFFAENNIEVEVKALFKEGEIKIENEELLKEKKYFELTSTLENIIEMVYIIENIFLSLEKESSDEKIRNFESQLTTELFEERKKREEGREMTCVELSSLIKELRTMNKEAKPFLSTLEEQIRKIKELDSKEFKKELQERLNQKITEDLKENLIKNILEVLTEKTFDDHLDFYRNFFQFEVERYVKQKFESLANGEKPIEHLSSNQHKLRTLLNQVKLIKSLTIYPIFSMNDIEMEEQKLKQNKILLESYLAHLKEKISTQDTKNIDTFVTSNHPLIQRGNDLLKVFEEKRGFLGEENKITSLLKNKITLAKGNVNVKNSNQFTKTILDAIQSGFIDLEEAEQKLQAEEEALSKKINFTYDWT